MCTSKGCIPGVPTYVYIFRLRSEVFRHRERALGDITLRNQYKEFFKGLSIAMNQTYNVIECVRAQIIVSQSRI